MRDDWDITVGAGAIRDFFGSLSKGAALAGLGMIAAAGESGAAKARLTAAEALVAAGATVVAVATVVDRDTGAQQVIENAGFRYLSAVSLDDLGLR